MKPIEGTVFKYGDHINTDLIIQTAHLSDDRNEMGKYCLVNLDPNFPKNVKQGDILVAGYNFGCGSTKAASQALLGAGIVCVVAKSFGRIFFRNAINSGLLVIESKEFVDSIETNERARIDFDNGYCENLYNGVRIPIPPYPPFIKKIIECGGIINMIKIYGIE
ncbi:MAG: 3-isopropylmalate dehydratase small subunit [Clostridiaceae bacterium]|jgi:3-isopropylmalate/(R)-2-methylmalate dehydratase small subunit|nr:3-isopropylmalate dehydratase small subunit [Clostridiaceae bacterium]